MRTAAVETLCELAARDRRVVLLTGDLGWTVVERFAERFPDRFVNGGVAEQNLVGVATGLAEGGYLPFVYSIAPFAALRPYEFVRNGAALMRLPVRVLGVGGGFEYGSAGPTHFGLEDLGAMRMLRGVAVLAPADAAQTRAAVLATWDASGPVYLRVGKAGRTPVPGLEGRFRLGRAEVVRAGGDVALLATGAVAQEACGAADLLADEGVGATVAVVACLAPEPRGDVADLLRSHPTAVTVEAHVRTGGLHSLVADVAAEEALRCRVHACHARPELLGPVGGSDWLLDRHGLSARAIAATARSAVRGTRGSVPGR